MRIDLEKDIWKLITEFGIGGGIKFLFLLFALIEYCLYKKMGHYSRSTFSWTNSFFIKMSFNFFLSINYAAFALTLGHWYYCLFFNSFAWLISCGLLYFEYIRKLEQSWLSLRLFWFINGLFYMAKISYTFICYFAEGNTRIALNLLFCYIIQSIPSFFLMAFSVLKPSDSEIAFDKKEENKNANLFKGSFISNLSLRLHKEKKTLVTVTITEHKPVKYEMIDNVLIPINVNSTKLEDIRLKLKVLLYPNKTYIVKKSLLEIIEFNCSLIEKAQKNNSKKKKKCTLVIQLKNLTNLFMKTSSCSSKLNELETVYSNLCQKRSFALLDFIKFCEVLDDKLETNLLNLFNQIKKRNYNGDDDKEMNIDLDADRDIIDIKRQNDFYSDIDDNYPNAITSNIIGMESNDVIKTSSYISSIINQEQPQKLRILSVNEKPKLDDSEIICEINSNITISISWKNLITLINHNNRISKTSTMVNLKKIVMDRMNFSKIKKEGAMRASIEVIFNEMINNLMYLDDLLFMMFNLNNIIKLDIGEIDMDIINSYFELDLFSAMNDPQRSIYYSNAKCNIESIKYYVSCSECNNDIALKIRVCMSIGTEKIWDTVICLNEMYKQCNEVILLNGSFQRFNSLNYLLKAITKTIKVIIQEYDVIEGNNNGDEEDDGFTEDKKIEKDSKEILLLSKNKEYNKKEWFQNLTDLNIMMNQFFSKKNLYIFYTPYFRKAFGINQYLIDGPNEIGCNDHLKGQNDGNNSVASFSNHNSFYENLIC